MNLIYDAWIPVRRKSGKKEKIAPWQVTENFVTDPVIELAAPRPDFNGALIQFLIGLLQTTCAPNSNKEWRAWRDNPPAPEELRSKFEEVAFAFNLDGDDPRFMQDLSLKSGNSKIWKVSKLISGQPGKQTEDDNKDHFIKRNSIKQLCCDCAATALLALQINAPAGGSGYGVGLRGAGPISTLVCSDNLWETIWFNILDKNRFENLANPVKTKDSDKFPWLKVIGSDQEDKAASDIHPAQIFWSMPRRIWLLFSSEAAQCDVCQEKSIVMVKDYFIRGYVLRFKSVVHPLTPTYKKLDKDKKTSIVSVQPRERVGYRHWLGFIQSFGEGDRQVAEVVQQAYLRHFSNFRLWAFGYEFEPGQDKATSWYEGIMPVVTIEDESQRQTYEAEIASIIQASDSIAVSLRYAVKDAWFDPQQKKNVDLGFVVQRFWQETEPDFYRHIEQMRKDIMADADGLSVKQKWHKCIVRKAEQIFDEVSQSEMIDEVNVKRVADSWNKLRRNIYGKKIKQDILGLPS